MLGPLLRGATVAVVGWALLAGTAVGQGASETQAKPGITILKRKDAHGHNRHVSYFVDARGVPVLTNRFEAYRNNPDYIEVRLAFEPIFVPGRSRFGGPLKDYEADDIEYLARRYAKEYGVDAHWLLAIMKAESDFDPYAVSKAGARGLMQLMPGTWEEMEVTDVFDPAQNIAAGAQYFGKLLGLFDGDRSLALAAYNAGPGAVKKYGGVPPYKETRAYVKRVQKYAEKYAREGFDAALKPGASKPSSDFLPAVESPFVVYFTNGSTQPADAIYDEDRYYGIEFAGRHYSVRKKHVERVEEAG